MTLIVTVVVITMVFTYITGFHDTANAIATTISTRTLSPRQAVVLATVFNLFGALAGTAVAVTVGKGLVNTDYVTIYTLIFALISATIWSLVTWWLGLPSSSSHALIGGLCGAMLASSGGNWHVIRWSERNLLTGHMEGLWPKVIVPMVASPLFGIVLGFAFMFLLIMLFHRVRPRMLNVGFRRLQLLSAAFVAFSHGTNDAQKTMGILALVFYTATRNGTFANLPPDLQFLQTPDFQVATWIKIACALTMAAGTAVGGWRIIRTLGHRLVRLDPIHGFAAQTTAATIILAATHLGMPLSTTHVISASIMGVGATKGISAVKWGVVGKMVWAWVLTLPITALLAYAIEEVCTFVLR